MAKGKHATALFEVIHSSKQFGGKGDAAGLLRTPKWWFKGRNKKQPQEPTEPAPAADEAPAPLQTTDTSGEPPPPAAAPVRLPAVDVLLDPQQHRITFRVTYTSAVVTCFAVAVVIALAYLVGRQMARGPAPALAGPSTEQLRQGPPQPSVMDVATARPGTTARKAAPDGERTVAPPPVQPRPTDSGQAPPPTEPGRRVSGLNYVIVQGYPDEASAKAAVEVLRQHGVGATIEKGLRGMRSDWFIVVGTDGFTRVSSPEFEQYMRNIKGISDKFIGKRSFKAFEPMGYRWDRP